MDLVVPPADGVVAAGLFSVERMERTAPTRDDGGATGNGTEVQH